MSSSNLNKKEYLGDGVYVKFDGFQLILTSEDGVSVSNIIFLEDTVYNNLIDYVKRLKEKGEE